MPDQPPIPSRIPLRLWLAAGFLLITAASGWIRLIYSIMNADLYQTLGMLPGPWYLTVNGLVSGVVYTLAGFVTLSKIKNRDKIVASLLGIGMIVFWLDRLFFVTSVEAKSVLVFSLVSSAASTIFVFCLVSWDTIKKRIRNGKLE